MNDITGCEQWSCPSVSDRPSGTRRLVNQLRKGARRPPRRPSATRDRELASRGVERGGRDVGWRAGLGVGGTVTERQRLWSGKGRGEYGILTAAGGGRRFRCLRGGRGAVALPVGTRAVGRRRVVVVEIGRLAGVANVDVLTAPSSRPTAAEQQHQCCRDEAIDRPKIGDP